MAEGLIETLASPDRLFGLPYILAQPGELPGMLLLSVKELDPDKREDALLNFSKPLVSEQSKQGMPRATWLGHWTIAMIKPSSNNSGSLKVGDKAKDNFCRVVYLFSCLPHISRCKIVVDLTNAHYPDYYRSLSRTLPRKTLDPTPFRWLKKEHHSHSSQY